MIRYIKPQTKQPYKTKPVETENSRLDLFHLRPMLFQADKTAFLVTKSKNFEQTNLLATTKPALSQLSYFIIFK